MHLKRELKVPFSTETNNGVLPLRCILRENWKKTISPMGFSFEDFGCILRENWKLYHTIAEKLGEYSLMHLKRELKVKKLNNYIKN